MEKLIDDGLGSVYFDTSDKTLHFTIRDYVNIPFNDYLGNSVSRPSFERNIRSYMTCLRRNEEWIVKPGYMSLFMELTPSEWIRERQTLPSDFNTIKASTVHGYNSLPVMSSFGYYSNPYSGYSAYAKTYAQAYTQAYMDSVNYSLSNSGNPPEGHVKKDSEFKQMEKMAVMVLGNLRQNNEPSPDLAEIVSLSSHDIEEDDTSLLESKPAFKDPVCPKPQYPVPKVYQRVLASLTPVRNDLDDRSHLTSALLEDGEELIS